MKPKLRGAASLPSILLLLAACRLAMATTYVVAPSGDDSAAGTEARPWKTLQKAAASVQLGDVVRIRAGEYFVGDTWRVSRAGTAEKPITYQAFGDGEVRITSSAILPANGWIHVKGRIYSTPLVRPALSVFQNALPLHHPGERARIYSVDEMIPNSFYVADKRTLYVWLEDGSHPKDSVMRAAPGHTVSLYDCHHTVFDGLTIEYGFNGIKDQGKATHHITIRNCIIRSIGSQGIQPVASDCIIEKNLFQKIGTNKFEHGIYGSKAGTIIRHNVFEETSGAGIHQYNANQPAGGNCEISGNIFRKPRKMTVRPGQSQYYLDIIAWGEGGNRIFNNVFHGEGKRGGISLNSIDNKVFHNTFVGSTYAVSFHAGRPGNQVFNNIVVEASRGFVIWPAKALPQSLDYNLYFSTSGTLRWERDGTSYRDMASWRQASGEAHSILGDPLLAGPGDARLRRGSPAIDAGVRLTDVKADFDAIARPQGAASDMGAHEARPGGDL